jgi:hypothetical protein
MNKIDLTKEFSKISPEFNVKMAGNGWIIDFSGRSHDEDWKNLTVIAPDLKYSSRLYRTTFRDGIRLMHITGEQYTFRTYYSLNS